jgi:TetR/AcrR family transcriptional regulator, mexJK operon transcriptional repressor
MVQIANVTAPSKFPISRNPAEVTRRILNAAEAEFIASGYEAASTNRIVTRFGGSKATLFRHFPTKELLLQAVIERIAGNWRGRVQPERITTDDPRDWLTEFGVETLSWILGEGPLFLGRLGIAEGHKLPQLSHLFHELAGAPLQAAAAVRIDKWTAEGKLRSRNPQADARSFFDLTVAGAVSRALYGVERLSGRELLAHAERAVDIFLEGRRSR